MELDAGAGELRRLVEGGVGDEDGPAPVAVAQQTRGQGQRGAGPSRFVGGSEPGQSLVQGLLVALEGGEQTGPAPARNDEHARVPGEGVHAPGRLAHRPLEARVRARRGLHARAHVHYQHHVSRLRGVGKPARVREREGEGEGAQQQREQAQVPEQLLQPEPALAFAQRLGPQRSGRHHRAAPGGAQAVEDDDDGERGEREQSEGVGEVHHRRCFPWRRYLRTRSSKAMAVLARKYSIAVRRQ